jgi:hypothetical protein
MAGAKKASNVCLSNHQVGCRDIKAVKQVYIGGSKGGLIHASRAAGMIMDDVVLT